MVKKKKIIFRPNLSLAILLFLGTISLSLTMVRSGLATRWGLGFWGPNGHDGIWHLAVINQAIKSFPPVNPIFSGSGLTNYHFGYDILVALLSKIFFLSPRILYFQLLPVATAFFLGLLSFWVGMKWKKDFWTGFWFAFLNFWAGSLGWIVTLVREDKVGGESMFWSMQSSSTLINPPFALSLIFLLWGMFGLLNLKKLHLKSILFLGLLFGLIINIKAYGGLVGLSALGGYCFFEFLKGRKKTSLIFLTAFGFSLGTFFITNKGGISLFDFNPLWFVHSMIESPDRFYWPKLALARYYLSANGLGLRLVLVELFGISIFLLGNLGIRVIGLVELVKKTISKKIRNFDWFLIFGLLASLFPAFLFTQKGTAWNTIQFFYYFLFFLNLYTASFLSRLNQKRGIFAKLFLGLLLIITLPTSLSSLRGYLGANPPAVLPVEERAGLDFLKSKPEGVVLTYPYDAYLKADFPTPLPLYVYETTAYVSAFSQKISFLEDEMNLTIVGASWPKRKEEVENFFETENQALARGILLNNRIDYVYLAGEQKLSLSEVDLGLEMIFSNKLVKIYQVRR